MDVLGLGLLAGGFTLTFGAPVFIAPKLRSRSDPNIVRPPNSAVYGGLMGLFAVPMLGVFGLAGNIFERGLSQLVPWSLLLVGFGGGGVVVLWLSLRYRVQVEPDRLIYHLRGQPDQIVEWANVTAIQFNRWTQNIHIKARDGRKFTVTSQDENIARVLERATLRNIPFVGFEPFK